MHLFFSVGEPSGDQHAAEVIEEIRSRSPEVRISGFGGPRMARVGCEQLYPLANHAVMGLFRVLPHLLMYIRQYRRAGRWFENERPDAVVLVDCPGFNWWIAKQAKKHGIPVFYYLPPQLWAWAPWRIRKVKQSVDHVLSALSFEVEWYRERGVEVEFVGHPFFAEVARHPLKQDVMDCLTDDDRRVIGVLPGSRNQEVRRNFPVMLKVLSQLHAKHPNVRLPVACYRPEHVDLCRSLLQKNHQHLPIELHLNHTSEIVEAAECCLMVSGSVSLELLARETPAVVLYRSGWLMAAFAKIFITCRYMTLVNLLAGRELMPEFPFVTHTSRYVRQMSGILQTWISSESDRLDAVRELSELRNAVAQPDGIERTAESILAWIEVRELKQAA
ncbi:MAG: lipid-A-disaccharide synthase [Planctomycetaceae bacterium]|nr:lipid-A-disaccharide synthase [Planctomycetaceae bacterium]